MSNYVEYYKKLNQSVYPSEWVIRAFLGKYKNYISPSRNKEDFEIDKHIFKNKKILDLGYGDGRNLNFFQDLEMLVYGIEAFEEVVLHSRELFPWAILKYGRNCKIPFKNNEFDFLLASYSIYYLDKGQTLLESLHEALRVIKPLGRIFFTLPTPENHYIQNAKKISSNQWILKDDFYNIRNGQIIETIDNEKNLNLLLDKLPIKSYQIAHWDVNWWGIKESSFIISATKDL